MAAGVLPEARTEAEARLAAFDAQQNQMSQVYFASFAGPRSRRYNRVELRLAPIAAGF